MTTPVGYIHAAKQTAALARREARPDELASGYPAPLRLGKIKSVETNGGYEVDVLTDAGGVATTTHNVRAVPAVTYEAGDVVWLVQRAGHQVLVILGASGNGGTVGGIDQGMVTE